MSRQSDGGIVDLLLTIIGMVVGLLLFLATIGCRTIYGVYARHSSLPLVGVGVGYAAAMLLALAVGVGRGAWGAAGLIAIGASVGFVVICWIVDVVATDTTNRALQGEDLADHLTSWWQQ